MSVVRTKKDRNNPYLTLNTTAVNDTRLSFRAKGLHTYLMARPDDWQVQIHQLEKCSPREKRDAIRAALLELEACGYARKTRRRDPKTGRMQGWDTTVYETPQLARLDHQDERVAEALETPASPTPTDDLPKTDKPKSVHPMSVSPKTDEPKSGEPKSGEPSSANPHLLINVFTHYEKEQTNEVTNYSPLPPVSEGHGSEPPQAAPADAGEPQWGREWPKAKRFPKDFPRTPPAWFLAYGEEHWPGLNVTHHWEYMLDCTYKSFRTQFFMAARRWMDKEFEEPPPAHHSASHSPNPTHARHTPMSGPDVRTANNLAALEQAKRQHRGG